MVFHGLPKNLVNFFTDFEVHQIVILKLASQNEKFDANSMPVEQFICNSVILAIHSEKFRKIISAGSGEIYLYRFNGPDDIETVRHCIEFMYGNRSVVGKVDNILGMFRFADIWDVPSLWFACLEQFREDLVTNPNKIFEFHQMSDVIASQDWRLDLVSKELHKIICAHADYLIQYIIDQQRLKSEIDHQVLIGLIKNSKTDVCGKFLALLLGSGDELRNLVLMNLQSIPVATAFANESEFLSFKALLSPSNRCKVLSISIEFYKHHPPEALETDDPPHNKEQCDLNCKTSSGVPVSSLRNTEHSKATSSCSHPKEVDKELSVRTSRVEKLRKQLFVTEISQRCRIPLSEYPGLIKKNFPLYTGLDIVAYFISRSASLNPLNLVNLLLPYFENPLIPVDVLEDIKVIAMEKCRKRHMRQYIENDLKAEVLSNRIDSYVISKSFCDINLFCSNLVQDKIIRFKLNDPVCCPLTCCNSSESDCQSHTIPELIIDYTAEPYIEFGPNLGSRKENIIHCYMLGISLNGTILSYIPLLQLTVSEIMDHIKLKEGSILSVRVIVVLSKSPSRTLDNFDNVLVGCLQQSDVLGKMDKSSLKSKTSCVNNDSNAAFYEDRDEISSNDLRRSTGVHRIMLLKGTFNADMIKSYTSDIIKGYPLYTRLESISLNISRCPSLKWANVLISLVLPYFANALVAKSLLQDIKALILNKHFFSKKKRKELSETVVVSDLPGRVKTFAISKFFKDMNVLREQLSQNSRICLQLNQGICCPFCRKIRVDEQSHMIDGFDIDLSLDSGVDFISEKEIHKDHIIHCYLLGLAKDGRVLKYVSLLQLTVSEILSLSINLSSVKIAVIYSEEFSIHSEMLDQVLVRSIYGNT